MTRDEAEEIKRHFDVVAEHLGSKIGLLAEGHQVLAGAIERVEGRFGSLEKRIDRLEGEIKAMLRLSFVELERRVLALESTVGDLADRIGRLEASRSQ